MIPLLIRQQGIVEYAQSLQAMREFTAARGLGSDSEIWLLQHPPVFTLGQAGKPEHILDPGRISVVQSDRGGQVTYHGPGQLIVYLLLDLRRFGLGVRGLVNAMEDSVIDLLADYGIRANARSEAPGVYVNQAKIASLGLRIRKGFSYHGLALNVDMDLEPFSRINPCGYPGLSVTQLADCNIGADLATVSEDLVTRLCARLQAGPTW